MFKEVIDVIISAARKLLTNWGASLVLFLCYLLLLGVCYLFFTTGEATLLQVFMSLLVLPVVAVVLFFLSQAMGLSSVRIGVGPVYLLRRALGDCWKLCLVSLPLLLLIGLVAYLFGWIQDGFFSESLTSNSPARRQLGGLFNWAEFLLLAVVFPLIAIHLWISTISGGVAATLSKNGLVKSLKRAFAPRSVLIYALVVVIFGAVAYLFFFTKTTAGGAWTEMWLLGGRLAAALIAIFLGWLLTLGSMAEFTARSAIEDGES